ncbi:MAG: heme-binding protein [Alphaproteobacteria bacterium]|jgi:uncharacterized protein GlcG (DUF336 family)|nr:heme-binding protein [Alphaproteobacteria bacterium]MBT4019888.1 heme-binding protein [Alphaproteobacteria bacterium]MBT4965774.1 heme-binding protein [Alphaproteobacteria bacterium]MBT5917629.1 heme-binding protein [Alphaproteobacteria bacterium]MBT7747410.1 heme-binding protein [Alphaproteobacteria bacterium]
MSQISLALANQIIVAALKAAREKNFQQLTVVVLDAGGHMVALQREDNSGILRVEIATGKAYGALGFGISSRNIGANNTDRPAFMAAVSSAADGKMIPVAGGVLIKNDDDNIIGAVGVSGDNSDNDEIAAIAGIEAAGLTAA